MSLTISIVLLRKGEPMQTTDKTKVDEIIDGLLRNNDLTASPEVWYGLHQIKKLSVTEIVRCGECRWNDGTCYCNFHYRNVRVNDYCSWSERKTDG